MATTMSTSLVHIHVIEDVVRKVRKEFIKYGGPGESVLKELQDIWEAKMLQVGGIRGPSLRRPAQNPTPPGGQLTHDLNVPHEGTEEYKTPKTEMLFPLTPVSTPRQGTADNSSMYNIPTRSSDYSTSGTENGSNADIRGKHSPYMPPPSPLANPRPDVNVAYMDGLDESQRGNSNQQFTQDLFVPSSGKRKRDDSSEHYKKGGSIPQQDGAIDAIPQIYNYQGPGEGYNEAPNDDEELLNEDDEELLNEDDDDDELDYLESGEEDLEHLVIAQFDKVTRRKSTWKCNLKNLMVLINDKDILFNKATGEFDF